MKEFTPMKNLFHVRHAKNVSDIMVLWGNINSYTLVKNLFLANIVKKFSKLWKQRKSMRYPNTKVQDRKEIYRYFKLPSIFSKSWEERFEKRITNYRKGSNFGFGISLSNNEKLSEIEKEYFIYVI